MHSRFLSLLLGLTVATVCTGTGDCPCGDKTSASCTIDNPGGGTAGGSGTSNQFVKMTGGASTSIITLHPGTNKVTIPTGFGRNTDGTVTFTIVADAAGTALPSNSLTHLDIYSGGMPVYYGPLPTTISWGDGTGTGITATDTGSATATATGGTVHTSDYQGHIYTDGDRLSAAFADIRLAPDDGKGNEDDKKDPAPPKPAKDETIERGPGGGLPQPPKLECSELPESVLRTLPAEICPSPPAAYGPKVPAVHEFTWKGGPRSEYTNPGGTVRRILHQAGMAELNMDSAAEELTLSYYANGAFDATSLQFPPVPAAVPVATLLYSRPVALSVNNTFMLDGDHNPVEGGCSFLPEQGVRVAWRHAGVTGAVAVEDRYSFYYPLSDGSGTQELHWAVVRHHPATLDAANAAKHITRGVSWSSWKASDSTDTLKLRTDVIEEIEFFAGGASTVVRRELLRYKFIPGIGDRLIERTVYPQTGESLTSSYLWHESGDFKGERKLTVSPDGSWSADVYARSGTTWDYTHVTYRPWKDGISAPAEGNITNSYLGTHNAVVSTVRTYTNGKLTMVEEKGPGGGDAISRTEYSYAANTSYTYTWEKRWIDGSNYMATCTARFALAHTNFVCRGKVAMRAEMKRNQMPGIGDVWTDNTNVLRRTEYAYTLVNSAAAPQSLAVFSGELFLMTTATEDTTRYPRFLSEQWNQFPTRRPVKSVRYIKPSSTAGQEVIGRSGQTYDTWGRLTEATSNTFVVENHDYAEVNSGSSTLLFSHTITDRTGQKTITWQDYLEREVQRVDYILPGVANSPPEFSKNETVTDTVFSPRSGGGLTTTVTVNSRYLGGALAGESRVTSQHADRLGRVRSSTATTGEVATYTYNGLVTTVTGLVLNAAGTGSTEGIHRREIRYRDGRPAQVYGAKVSAQWYDYGADDVFVTSQTVTGSTAASTSGKFDTALPTADSTTAVVTYSDGLGRPWTQNRRLAPGLNPVDLSTSYGDDGRLLYQEERTTGEGNAGLKRYGKQTLTWDAGNGEWISAATTTLVNGATTTEHYPSETLSRYAKINNRWTSITRTRRKDSSGNWEVLSSRHEEIGPWPIGGPSGSLQWSSSKSWRGDNTNGSGTPAAANITYIWRDRAKVRTETTTADCLPVSSTNSWNGLLYESFDGTCGGLTLYDYTGLREVKAVRDPRLGGTSTNPEDGKWSLISIAGSTGRRTAYRQVGVLPAVTATMAYTYYPATDWRSGRVSSVTNAANEVTWYSYDDAGRTTHTWGTAGYPSAYAYDSQGRLTQLRTYRAGTWNDPDLAAATFGTAAELTQWTYDNPTGLLTTKTYHDSKDTLYPKRESDLLVKSS